MSEITISTMYFVVLVYRVNYTLCLVAQNIIRLYYSFDFLILNRFNHDHHDMQALMEGNLITVHK